MESLDHRQGVQNSLKIFIPEMSLFVFPKLKSVDSIEKIEGDLQGFWLVNITVDDLIQARSVILEDTDRGFLMDWEE